MNHHTDISSYLDSEGRVTVLPSRKNKNKERSAVYSYLAEKFQADIRYTEKEVNEIINRFHSFGDHALLRRELIVNHHLCRTRDGSAYWRNVVPAPEETVA